MNWEAAGAIGEIVGAIAVVATLVYLALQLRVAKQLAVETNRMTRSEGARTLLLTGSTNLVLREAVGKAYGLGPYYQRLAKAFALSEEEPATLDRAHNS